MPVNKSVHTPANIARKTAVRPIQANEIHQFLKGPAACKPNVQGHHLHNIHLSPSTITSSPVMLEPFSITNHEGLTCGGLQFQPVEPDRCNTLNFSSLDTLLQWKDVLSASVQMKTGALDNKRTNYSETYWYENYFAQSCLISMLDQTIATRVCFCGLKLGKKLGVGKPGLCNKPRLCMHCARRNVQKTLKTFQPVFHQHEWGFLTISYTGSLNFTHTSGSDWWLHWEAARSALKRLVGSENVEGAMIREELAILSLNPTRVQPHIHAIVPTGELSQTAIQLLTRWTQAYCDDMGDSVSSAPSVKFESIATEEDFVRVVRYLHKPIDLVTPYQTRWIASQECQDKAQLNRATRDIIEATIMLPKDRIQVDYFGNMRAASRKTFIGVPQKDRV